MSIGRPRPPQEDRRTADPRRQISIIEEPLVAFGPETCGELEPALRREWLVTNGLGGFASGTLAGIPTRRYHGLLVAATRPPAGRRVLVAGLVEWATAGGAAFALHALEFEDGTIDQHGYRLLQSFELDGMLPVWRFAIGGTILERRVWMAYGSNTTFVRYEVARGDGVELEITPLLTDRDFHSLTRATGGPPAGAQLDGGDAEYRAEPAWFYGLRHREEAARGLDSLSDAWAPGSFRVRLGTGESWTLTLSADEAAPAPDLRTAQARQVALLDQAGMVGSPRMIQQLVLAADQFLVRRGASGRTVIAGYHWFADWGRDTMIALPGLTLATGRQEEGAAILRTFGALVVDGLLPNNLPEGDAVPSGYNTVDAALWFVQALRAHMDATHDDVLLAELLPTVLEILQRYAAGTRYGIAVDPSDGLLRAGEPGLQLTWMDARVGDREITPRIGKPVEVNAFWLNALDAATGWLPPADPRRGRLVTMLELGRASFSRRFWLPDLGYLADVVDGPNGDDPTLRPNQILALSLPTLLVTRDQAAAILRVVESHLLTPYGLRTLDPRDPAYHGAYGGDAAARDGSYHQGPAWTWLIGPYAEAVARYRSPAEARGVLRPFAHHLLDAGLGSISELLDGDPPYRSRGAIAQAWGVAELLHVRWKLEKEFGSESG